MQDVTAGAHTAQSGEQHRLSSPCPSTRLSLRNLHGSTRAMPLTLCSPGAPHSPSHSHSQSHPILWPCLLVIHPHIHRELRWHARAMPTASPSQGTWTRGTAMARGHCHGRSDCQARRAVRPWPKDTARGDGDAHPCPMPIPAPYPSLSRRKAVGAAFLAPSHRAACHSL